MKKLKRFLSDKETLRILAYLLLAAAIAAGIILFFTLFGETFANLVK